MLKIWGRGIVNEVSSIDSGQKIILRTPIGVYLYDANSLENQAFFENAETFSVSPDSHFFAVAYAEGIVDIWDSAEITQIHSIKHEAATPKYPPPDFKINDLLRITAMSFSVDGSLFAVGFGDNQIKLFQMSNGELIHIFESNFTPIPVSLIFSPDGKYLISDDRKIAQGATRKYINTLAIWSVETGDIISTIPEAGMLGNYPIDPASSMLATGQLGGYIFIYNFLEGKLINSYGSGTGFPTVDFSIDGKYLYINGGWQIRRIEDGKQVILEDKEKLRQKPSHLAYLSDEQKRSLQHIRYIDFVRFNDEDGLIVWGRNENIIFRWDIFQESIKTYDIESRRQRSLAVSPNEEYIASCVSDGTRYYKLYVISTIDQQLKKWGICNGIVVFTPDNQSLLKNYKMVDILQLSDGELRQNLRDHDLIATSQDDRFILTKRNDGKYFVWRIDLSEKYELLENPPNLGNQFVTSPDESIIVTNGTNTRVWRLEDGWQIKIISIKSESLAFSPDGAILAIGDSNGIIHLIDVSTWEELAALQGHQDEVVDLVFGPEGKNIISVSLDGTVRLWGLQP